jgi:chemotaxis protein CheX
MGTYTAPFVASLTDIFASMFSCEVSLGESHLQTHTHATRDVTGIIGLAGKADGNIIISLDRDVALSLTEAMLGQRPDMIDENVIDAVGETVNIVVGNAKSKLDHLALNIGIPTVVTGRGQSIRFTGQTDPFWFVFHSAWGSIDMCVGLAAAQVRDESPALCSAR